MNLGMAIIEGGSDPLISRVEISAASDERHVRRIDDLARDEAVFGREAFGGFGRLDVYCAIDAINRTSWWTELSRGGGRVFAFCLGDDLATYRWAIWENGACVRWCTDFGAGFDGPGCLDNDGTQLPVGPRHALEGEHDEVDARAKILAMLERMTGVPLPEWLSLPLLVVSSEDVALGLLPPPEPSAWYPGPTELDLADERTLVGIERCAGLRELIVGSRIWDLEPLRACRTLQVLDVSGSLVTDLSPLHDLPELHTLALHHSLVSEAEVAALRKRRPDLRIFPPPSTPHTVTWAGSPRPPRPEEAPAPDAPLTAAPWVVGVWIEVMVPGMPGRCTAYTYVDGTAGLAAKGFDRPGPYHGAVPAVTLRLDGASYLWRRLTPSECRAWDLALTPSWLSHFGPQPPVGSPHVPPRAAIPESDVQVLILRPHDDPGPSELVWVRPTGADGDLEVGALLNQPHAIRGLALGQSVRFAYAPAKSQRMLIPSEVLAERNDWSVTPCAACGFQHVFEPPSVLLRRTLPELPAHAEMVAFTTRCRVCGGAQRLTAQRARPTAMVRKKPWWRLW